MILLMAILIAVTFGVSEAAPADPKIYTMVLATNQTTSGVSETATNVAYCTGSKVLEIKVSGATVNIACTIAEGANGAAVKTITLTAPGVTRLTTTHYVESLYVQSIITSGTVDSITLRCN
jgi:hypothetical protein